MAILKLATHRVLAVKGKFAVLAASPRRGLGLGDGDQQDCAAVLNFLAAFQARRLSSKNCILSWTTALFWMLGGSS